MGCSQSIRHLWSSPGKKMQLEFSRRTGVRSRGRRRGRRLPGGLGGHKELGTGRKGKEVSRRTWATVSRPSGSPGLAT